MLILGSLIGGLVVLVAIVGVICLACKYGFATIEVFCGIMLMYSWAVLALIVYGILILINWMEG